jgi:hemoglobin/transferrin/lactoferrin receptor protein
MRTFFLMLLFSCLNEPIWSQAIMVEDKATRQALEGATLFHAPTMTSAVTDSRGRADISAFAGADTILIRMVGYQSLAIGHAEIAKLKFRISLTRQAFALNELVISANRWEQESKRIPDQITVISQRDVALHNPGTSAYMLERTGEVFMQRSQLGGGSPMVRGFGANRLLIVVDGVRMNNAIFRAGNLQNVISADINAIERAEVLHGPGAMTYGSDAIGGVIDFHMIRPRFSSDSTMLVRAGAMTRYASAANEYGGNINFGIGGRKLAFVGSASAVSFGDLRMGSHGPDDLLRPWYSQTFNGVDSMVMNNDPELQVGSGYDNINLVGKLAYKPIEQLEVGVNMYYSTTSDIPRYDRLIELRPNGLPRSAEWYYGPQEWLMGSLTAKHAAKRGPWSTARFSFAYQGYNESRNDRNFRSANKRTQVDQVSGIWANLDLEKVLNSRTQLLYGAEFVTNEVNSTGVRVNQNTGEGTIINSRYPDGSTWSTGSVYVGTMHDATERLTVSAGMRFNWTALECAFDTALFPYPVTVTSLQNSALTGNLSIAYRPGTEWKLSLDLSTGFRAPNIDDIGKVFDSEPGAVIVPNPDLVPEYAYSVEAGIERTINDRVRIRTNGYYVLLDNAMVRRPFTLNGQDSIDFAGEASRVDAIQNAAEANVVGFLLAVDASLWEGLGLMVRYNWQRGVEQDDANTTDVPLRHAPPPFGRAGFSWNKDRLRVELFSMFSGGFTFEQLAPSEQAKLPIYPRDANGDPHSPSWYTLNLKGSYQINKLLQVSGGVENLTDQRYRPYSSGISAPGRNFILALRARF